MKAGTVSNALSGARDLVEGLGGPQTNGPEDRQYAVKIPPPPDAADAVVRRLVAFADAVAEATNVRLVSLVLGVSEAGRRDGLLSIPDPRGAPDLARPPYVAGLVDVGRLAIANAQTISDLHRAEFTLDQGVAAVSATARVGQRRRLLHLSQLGLLVLVLNLATACFVSLGSRIGMWSGTEPTSPTWVPDVWVLLATVLIVLFGILAGFYRATRERTLMKLRSGAAPEADSAPDAHVTDLADRDPLVQRAWVVGLGLSMAIALLMGVADVLAPSGIPLVRALLGVAAWLWWGAITFVGTTLLTQLSQHWINVVPVEIDLTDADRFQAEENGRSADVGDRYVATVLADQRAFVIAAVVALISRYYEANLVSRRSSGTADLDHFVLSDIEVARTELLVWAPADEAAEPGDAQADD